MSPHEQGTQYPYETERTIYRGSSQLALVNTCYNGATIPRISTAITYPLSSRTVQTTLPSTSPSQICTTYNTYSLPTEVEEYTWGGSTPSRTTLTTYTSCGVTNAYVVNRPCSVTVDGTGSSPAAQAAFTYDANGNLLTESHTNTTGSPTSISRSFTYHTNGTLKTATDFNGNSTTYAYGSASCNGAFRTTVTPPITSLAINYTYDCNGGVMTQVTDPNTQSTKFAYTDPNHFWRLTGITYPDQSQTNITYTDSANGFQIATSRLLSSTLGSHTVTQYLDGLGRVKQAVDSQGCARATSTVATSYDSLGRVHTVTNPYCTTSEEPAPAPRLR